ncbi:putative sigma-54 modulation protein [Roseimicrobium gellanilyticum]|uniref:Ribosome hibernation promoting factor n=1 Tax=Roseimicrobium gellanilyticum TaxID=748857 RepID=A0A366HN41_9BACT|nr:ribosome-associated translation inhibitor RaiA [Roseimicrobium gellanilyticum]RBP44569.1 putative sigma-54 modulation protein [Roseimicrobium gellanilyticum]
MQVHNVNLPITVTGRHVSVTEPMRDYAQRKVENLHLDYPRIIDAKIILDVENKERQKAEIILHCANHITIEVDTTTGDIYSAIDESVSKIARRMRKFKTRLLKSHHRPRNGSIKHIQEQVFTEESMHANTEHDDIEPVIIHRENFRMKPLFPDEAIMDLELSDRPFVLFHNAKNDGKLAILFRRKDGEYGMVEPEMNGHAA